VIRQAGEHGGTAGTRSDSERFAYATLDALSEHVAVLDERGTVIAVNRAWREFAGANSLSPEGLGEGSNYFAACVSATGEGAADAARFAAGLRAVIGGSLNEFSLEYPCHSPTQRRWFIARATRFELEGHVRAVVTHANITKRRLAEEALRFRSHLLDTVEQAVIATDVNGTIVYWNLFAEKLYGWPAAEITGRNIIEIAPTQAAKEQAAEIMSRLAAGQSWAGEFTVRRRDGTTFQAFVTDTPIYDDKGALVGIVGVSSDVTARKLAEERLRESEERYRAIVNQAMVGVAHSDLSGRLTIVNQRYCDIMGYSESELLGMRMQNITHPDDVPLNVGLFERLVAEGAPFEIEKRSVRKDGSIIWVSNVVSAIRDREGKPQSAVAVVLDITERRRMGMLLDAQKQSLEMLVGGSPLVEVLIYLTRAVERQAEGRAVASILLLDEQGRLHNGASPSLPDAYLKAIDGIKADPEVGTCSAAAAYGTVVITPDIAADPKWQRLRHLPLELGFRAAWSMPIMARDGRVLGTFGTYFRERREPEALERQAVDILAHTAALAIERKLAEQRLTESEEQLRMLFEASRDGILVEDGETIFYANRAYARMLGYDDPDELRGRHVSSVVASEDAGRMLDYGRRRRAGGTPPAVYEFKGRCKDGSVIDLEASVSTHAVAGKTYVTTAVRDISERRHVEEALRQSEGKYRLLMEQASDGIHIYDLTGNIIETNSKLCEMLGYTRAELLLLNVEDLIAPEDLAAAPIRFDELQAGQTLLTERRLRRKDGTLLPVEISGRMIRDGVLQSIIRDISERKRAEEELHKAYDELERRVQERTAQLARANATLKVEIAERLRAEEARKELLLRLVAAQEQERQRISRELHDQMGQQLAALMMGLKTLDGNSYGRQSTLITLEQLQEITDQLSREVHTLAWGLRPPVLDDLGLHTALYNYAEEWAERSRVPVDFHSAGFEDGRLPLAYETALYRIAQEALTNVSKHSEADRVSFILEWRGDHVLAVVEDNGKGFDVEALMLPTGEGRKLGLLGMRERAALLGGTINIESEPGAGTSVFVRIPVGARGDEGGGSHG
jgi:PAS domain S-box-containing protein